ncbi:MAG: hypothetical protein HYR67_05795 [Bacteroidetes bacterium]|nr:hypothetical protein [Bacteroidota bacterium]
MKTQKNIFSIGTLFMIGLVLLDACQPDKAAELGDPPKASFTSAVDANGYSVTLSNTSAGPTIAYWSVPGMNLGYSDLKGDVVTINFTFPGTYTVKMRAIGHGGMDSTKVDVTTTKPNPEACKSTAALGFIASCTSKKWKLIPAAGAYKIGPGPNDGSWWSNGAGDVTSRACEFDDEYTFSFDAAGTFVYNSHGDFYGDGYMGDNSNACQPESNFTAKQAPWGSGGHNYAVIPNAGLNKLGQLKVIGLGAHMGLQKVTTSSENASGPVSSITYDILSMTQDPNGDVLVLGANMGWGWWTFTFKSF